METIQADDLRTVAEQEAGPCITLVLPPANDARDRETKWRNTVRELERELSARYPGADKESLLAKVRSLEPRFDDVNDNSTPAGGATLVMVSEGFQRAFSVPEPLQEAIHIGPHFRIKDLLRAAAYPPYFYLLGLSRKRTRLLKCSLNSSEEVTLPDDFPTNQEEALQYDDHEPSLNAHAGAISSGAHNQGSPGHGGAVMFGNNNTDSRRTEQFRLFATKLGKALHSLLVNETAPLVVACVEWEWPIFRTANQYAHLLEFDHVKGAPDGLKGGEMHKRALDIIEQTYQHKVQKALENLDRSIGPDKATTDINTIVKASHEGRIHQLFVAEGAELLGRMDESTHSVRPAQEGNPATEDLLNLAALQTLTHAGEVFLVPADRLPGHAAMGALFRYAIRPDNSEKGTQ